ncbi:uridine phosphorylase [Candidatus Peregrinibacteria bacterium]|nr:uridine phosphorylase [Candidatus Peregrinibacteria bacterium]
MKSEARNPHLDELDIDFLYHLGLNTGMDLKNMFSGVKYVCMGGSADRAEALAQKAAEELGVAVPEGGVQTIGKTERFSLYRVGPVISCSHGMGMPSMSILLHEMAKLMDYAGCQDVQFIRVGTSGGVGVEPGTVIVAEEGLNGKLQLAFEQVELGETYSYQTRLDRQLAQDILAARGDIRAQLGKTMGTDDFYEGQGRLDGALKPRYTEAQRMAFLRRANEAGVRNIEMEAPAFAAFCLRAGIPAAIVCTTLLNRLEGDQVRSTPEQLAQFSDNAQRVVLRYIRGQLGKAVAGA